MMISSIFVSCPRAFAETVFEFVLDRRMRGFLREELSSSVSEKAQSHRYILIDLSELDDTIKHLRQLERRLRALRLSLRAMKKRWPRIELSVVITATVGDSGHFTRRLRISETLLEELSRCGTELDIQACPCSD